MRLLKRSFSFLVIAALLAAALAVFAAAGTKKVYAGTGQERCLADCDPSVAAASQNADTIDTLANYAKGKYINLAYSGMLPEGTQLSLLLAGNGPVLKQAYGKWILIAEGVVILGLILALILVATKRKGSSRGGRRVHRDEYPDDFFERNLEEDGPEDAGLYETGFDEPLASEPEPDSFRDDAPKILEPYDSRLKKVRSAKAPDVSAEEKAQALFREQKPQGMQGGASSLTQALRFIDYGDEEAGKGGASSLTQALSYIDYGEEEAGKSGASSLTQALSYIDYGEDETK